VYWTELGPPVDPTFEYSGATLPVVAALYADGTAQWWSLPDGWFVAASDQWGTILAHATQDTYELALFPGDAGRFPQPAATAPPNDGATGSDRPCTTPDGLTIPGPVAGSELMILSAASLTGPVIGTFDAPPASNPAAIIGPVGISADGSTIAATIDRRGPDDMAVTTDQGSTWTTVATAADIYHIALDETGATLAVAGVDTLTLHTLGSPGEGRLVPLPVGTVAVDAVAFSGSSTLVAALETGGEPSEFAGPAKIFLLDTTTGAWSQAPTAPDTTGALITSVVATHDEVTYVLVPAPLTGPAPTAQVWTVRTGGAPTLRYAGVPNTATLVGITDTSVLIGVYDDTATYRIIQRGGGDTSLDLGCIRPAAATDLNNDPDKQ
jgi:hypothetical protein